MKKTLNHVIFNKGNQCHYKSDQLLLYIKREKGVGKNKVVRAIHLGFNYLKKQTKLLILAPTRATMAKISGATIYGALSIYDCILNKNQYMVKGPWQNFLTLIMDEISMVSLKLLLIVNSCLNQAKGKTNNYITILGGLALIIVIRDFSQFFPVIGRSLWDHPITNKEIHNKSIWNQFILVIALIEQIQ